MKFAPYLFAQLVIQLSFLSVSALDIEKPAAVPRQADVITLPDRVTATEAALEVPPKAWELYEEGLEAQKRDDFDAALKAFDAALKLYPDFALAFEGRGTTLLWQKKLAEAQQAFHKALALDPEIYQAELGLGLVMNGTGQFQGAIEHLQRALNLNGECWQVRYALGRAYYGSGQHLKAELNLKLARAWQPQYPSLYLLLALVLVDEGKSSEALAEMERFLRVYPDDPLAGQIRAKLNELRGGQAE